MNLLSLDGAQWSSLMRLSAGTQSQPAKGQVTATVKGFSAGKAVLDVGGKTVLADSKVPLKVGQELKLAIVGGKDGQVILRQIGSPNFQNVGLDEQLTQVLKDLGLPQTPQAKQAATLLLQSGFQLSKASLQQAMAFLQEGGDPLLFTQTLFDQNFLEALPPNLMGALAKLWKKSQSTTPEKSEANPTAIEEKLLTLLKPSAQPQAAALLGGVDPRKLAQLLEEGLEEELAAAFKKLPESLLKNSLMDIKPGSAEAKEMAFRLSHLGTEMEWAQQTRAAMQQLQGTPISFGLPSPDPSEREPIEGWIKSAEESDEVELVLKLNLSGLGPMEARFKSQKSGGEVKVLFRALEVQTQKEFRNSLKELLETAEVHGLPLKAAVGPLAPVQEGPSDLNLDVQI